VVVLFDEYNEDWERLAWVQVYGLASFIETGPDWDAAAALLEARYPQYAHLPLADHPVILIQVQRIVHWRASDPY
jgi:hypothetical protein